MKEIFAHSKITTEEKEKPYILTMCILKEEDKVLAVGASLCSPEDNYNRKLGNRIARGRAIKALDKKQDISPIGRKMAKVFPCRCKGIFIK